MIAARADPHESVATSAVEQAVAVVERALPPARDWTVGASHDTVPLGVVASNAPIAPTEVRSFTLRASTFAYYELDASAKERLDGRLQREAEK